MSGNHNKLLLTAVLASRHLSKLVELGLVPEVPGVFIFSSEIWHDQLYEQLPLAQGYQSSLEKY